MSRLIRIHESDNVAVAAEDVAAGAEAHVGAKALRVSTDVPAGHKVALTDLTVGAAVVKYGFPIGHLTEAVHAGDWIHSHNLSTALSDNVQYEFQGAPSVSADGNKGTLAFMGYRRKNGRVGTRNEIWIINTVGCVNHAAERIAKLAADRFAARANERFANRIDGVHSFSHPYGCSQLGDDLKNTQRVLAGMLRHPNVGGVLVLGLGCENNQMQSLLAAAGDIDQSRLRFFNTQEVIDEIETGLDAVDELVVAMENDERVECPVSDLIIGMKCGGSDGFSGISANPLVGRIADRLTSFGGGAILTEVPEMFGAEQVLMARAENKAVFDAIGHMIDEFKEYFRSHDQPIYENPSPGNKQGGLTTLEEKSLGAIQKGGRATVTSVLDYGELAPTRGLSLLQSPGNDGVSSTAMVASGATMLLFTTGRGTPLGFPVPTVKISSNTAIAEKKPHWIDFNAGELLDGTADIEQLADRLFAFILDVASGRAQTNNEKHGYREIAIWKEGVTL
ncbi:MAG TPA: altronate dehydratase family protein [Longimicrobiales bacterium]|nr:altronate dehydratase family protein [Longimicrobiales bacterium]